jgi:hypothetical protein
MNCLIVSLFIILLPLLLPAQISWTIHTITNNFDGACSVHAQDINGDSMVDILGAAIYGNKIALWTNNGGNPVSWNQQIIDANFYGASYVFASDIDSDGDFDVLASAWNGNQLAWWENGGGNPIVWTKHIIDAAFQNAHEVTATDMDGDNDIDVLGAAALNDEIAWFENDGLNPITWTKHTIDNNFDGVRSVKAVDIDGDGLKDVVGAALLANAVTWWRNNGDATWTEHTIDNAFGMAHMVYSFDIDGDGDSDVVAVAYTANAIAWWRNDGGTPIQWTKQIIDGSFLGPLGVYVKDINNDGHLDILGTADILDDVAWWSNDGNVPIIWTKQIIHGSCDGAWPVYAEDIDGDGDNDVIAAATNSDAIYWYENDLTGINEGEGHYLPGSILGPTIIRGPLRLDNNNKIQIYDIAGRRVSNQPMEPGVYFIVTDGETVGKVIEIK